MKRLLLFTFLIAFLHSSAQHQDKVDFIRGEILIQPNPEEKQINGTVIYEFNVLKNVDSVFLDARNMNFSSVLLNGKKAKYSNTGKTISIRKKLKGGKPYVLKLDYSSKPKQAVYFFGFELPDSLKISAKSANGEIEKHIGLQNAINIKLYEAIKGSSQQIWTQGQGKYTSNWLPSFDDMEERVEFDLTIAFKKSYEVIANGRLLTTEEKRSWRTWRFDMQKLMSSYLLALEKRSLRIWQFDMQKPMSSYLLAFAIGNYDKQELKSSSGIPIENYYYPQDSLKVEPTYRYTKEIFDFLEKEIGVQYPWQNYKQIPVRDFLYAGMENTGATIFSDGYVIDSTAFVDKNYVNVNAHEMAHQWFGNLVTEKNGNHHWLHEGFATYYAYLAEKELFGEDHFYWKLYKSLNELQNKVEKGEGQSLLDPKASSLTFYEKGSWALFILRNEIGDAAFKKGIKSYLEKFQFKNVTVGDFLNEMETASETNLSGFRERWLENTAIPLEEAKNVLSVASSSIKLLSEMEAELKAAQNDDIDYQKYWDATKSIHLKKHLLENYQRVLPTEILLKAFESDTLPIRQSLLASPNLVKDFPKEKLESLLGDDSYITKENALFSLWREYPEDGAKFLDKTKGVIGLPNKNVRLMWLTLAILTDGYEARNTKQYFDELSGYTSPDYSFEIRQGAFFYLDEAFGLTDENLRDLLEATNHHSWQFRKYARNLLDKLLKDADYKIRISKISKELKPEEIRYLNSKLKIE